MDSFALILIGLVIAVFGTLGVVAWVGSRNRLREAKNFERGLKMVPMLIHLPPQSSDIESGSRDRRDVADEAISQAQTLYDILASTAQKGFKSNFYGQRHISLEIIAVGGRVHFYTAVPVALVSVVQQAIVSAYPAARLEEVEEHNLFSPVGKLSGTIGGELMLKEDFIKPIATFQDSKRDTMAALLNALSDLDNKDGAGIQIMLRPARDGWEKRGLKIAKEKKEGKKKSGILSALKDLPAMLWNPQSSDKSESKGPATLTNLEQGEIDAIENKTKYAAYETMIRVVSSSESLQRSRSILNNIVATFALFDAPGHNGFKFAEARDIESFVTAYILRFFPPESSSNILNSVELATIFHFPDQSQTPTSQLERQGSKQVDGPRNMPAEGMLLGYNIFRGVKKEIRLSDNDRRRHLYIVGQTGTGKSVLLENLALQDMLDGKGFAFVDPHGDTVEALMGKVPKERIDDIIYFSPADMDYPMGLNLFEFDTPDQKDFLIQEAINMLYKLYDPQHQGIIGPRYEHWFRNASLTLMADPKGSTFIDIPKVFTDNAYAKQKLQYVTDQTVLDFWNKEMAQTSDYHKSEVLGWFVSKFGAFLSNEMMRNIIGQTQSAFNLREVMDEGKILFVNLSKGRTGELNSKLLGMIFVMKFQAAAMSRANIPEDQRRDFSLYVDEFQNFSTDSFSSILSEARKYRLNLIVANQFISQLSDDIRDAVFGNVGSVVSLRTGATDADFLVKQFSPTFDADDLVQLPNFNAVSRIMANNVPSQPFSMATIPPLGHNNQQLSDALKRMSYLKNGKPRGVVEKEIFDRLKTLEPPKPKPALGGGAPPPRPGARPTAANPNGKPSFLDDWLEKRKKRMASGGQPAASDGLNKRADAAFGAKQTTPAGGAPTPTAAATKPPAQPPTPPQPKPPVPAPVVHKDGSQDMGHGDELKIEKSPDADKKAKAAQQESVIASSVTDNDNAKKMGDAIKSQSKLNDAKPEPAKEEPASKPAPQPKAAEPEKPAPEPEKTPEEMMSEDDEMYIDKDGNIHYKEDLL